VSVPACLRLADDIFPLARALAARRLVEAGWSQTRTAKALGVSQAMVSKHLAARPPRDVMAIRLADDLVVELLHPKPAIGQSVWCATLSMVTDKSGSQEAVTDLLAAEALLMRSPPLQLMPQVGLNIARALPAAKNAGDILAFPGRLVEAGGRILRPAPPTFGGSSHLAQLLLLRPGSLAVANVRGGLQAMRAAHALGLDVRDVARPGGDASDAPIHKALATLPDQAVLSDLGAVGLEPCLYVFGPDATHVARIILRLHDTLVKS
jgi:predicted fused transcriptional regulator/phosphomethylpyrimidine kinase